MVWRGTTAQSHISPSGTASDLALMPMDVTSRSCPESDDQIVGCHRHQASPRDFANGSAASKRADQRAPLDEVRDTLEQLPSNVDVPEGGTSPEPAMVPAKGY